MRDVFDAFALMVKVKQVLIGGLCPTLVGIPVYCITLGCYFLRMQEFVNKDGRITLVIHDYCLLFCTSDGNIEQAPFLTIWIVVSTRQDVFLNSATL